MTATATSSSPPMENEGVVVEVHAQSGFVALESDKEDREKWYEFSLMYTKYLNMPLTEWAETWQKSASAPTNEQPIDEVAESSQTAATASTTTTSSAIQQKSSKLFNDWTDLVCVNDRVSYTLAPYKQGGKTIHRVVDLLLLDDPFMNDDVAERQTYIEHDTGMVTHVHDNGGTVSNEKWGNIEFEFKSLLLTHGQVADFIRNPRAPRSARNLIGPGRPVYFKAFPVPPNTKWTIISMSPLGEKYTGDGVIVEIRNTSGIIGSYGFGQIYMPYESLRLKAQFMPYKQRYWPNLVGYRCRFTIARSLPHHRVQYRAIDVQLI